MKIRIIGGGWYGCHIAKTLLDNDYDVEIHEIKDHVFAGASGANVSRLHGGAHYPRSFATRKICRDNFSNFMGGYGRFTRGIPINIYAIAKHDSLVDYGNFIKVLQDEIQYIEIYDPSEFGLHNVEGAILIGERHILLDKVQDYFTEKLKDIIIYNSNPGKLEGGITIDCTYCNNTFSNIARYEPCISHRLKGSWDTAVTIVDGQFPSLYPSYEAGTITLTSALYTPLSKDLKTYSEAVEMLRSFTSKERKQHLEDSLVLMERYYPRIREYSYIDSMYAIRALPRSGADSRLWDIAKIEDNYYNIRAGKIDGVIGVGEQLLKELANQ